MVTGFFRVSMLIANTLLAKPRVEPKATCDDPDIDASFPADVLLPVQ